MRLVKSNVNSIRFKLQVSAKSDLINILEDGLVVFNLVLVYCIITVQNHRQFLKMRSKLILIKKDDRLYILTQIMRCRLIMF